MVFSNIEAIRDEVPRTVAGQTVILRLNSGQQGCSAPLKPLDIVSCISSIHSIPRILGCLFCSSCLPNGSNCQSQTG